MAGRPAGTHKGKRYSKPWKIAAESHAWLLASTWSQFQKGDMPISEHYLTYEKTQIAWSICPICHCLPAVSRRSFLPVSRQHGSARHSLISPL